MSATPAPKAISVMIVDDHPVVRAGLRAMIDAEPDLKVVAEAGSGEEAVSLFPAARPDVTLMDLRMPKMSGPEAIAAIRRQFPDAHVIVLTTFDGDQDVFRAVQAGARGYLLKGTFREGLMEAIRNVHAGQKLIAPEVAARMAERLMSKPLSAREVQVLELVAKGLSNKEVGTALFVAEDTVKNHLKRIYEKLGVADRTEAAMVAIQRRIITID
jgi:two-component system NarL family response regulator